MPQAIGRGRHATRWALAIVLAAVVLAIVAAATHFLRSPAKTGLTSWERDQMTLGTLAVRARRAAEAQRIFRGVADRDPQALEPRRNLVYLLGLQMRTAEAHDILWQIYQIDQDPRVLVDLVLDLLADQQDVRGLAPELVLLVAQTPDDPFLRRAWAWPGSTRVARKMPCLTWMQRPVLW